MCLVFLKNSKLTSVSELLHNPNNFFGNKNVAMYSMLVVLLGMQHCFIFPHEIGFEFEKIA
jgi:hypothetical protein